MIIVFDYVGFKGEVMMMVECMLFVVIDVLVLGCMVVGEVIMNIVSVLIVLFDKLKLFVNWMVVCGMVGEDVVLFDMVKVIGMELCLVFGIGILVGKDLLLMKMKWDE